MKSDFKFLPTTRDEMKLRGWDALDVLLVMGDAYIDHPSFGIPLLGEFSKRRAIEWELFLSPTGATKKI